MMQELNEQDLEQVVGGTANGATTGFGQGSSFANGYGSSSSYSGSTSTLNPNLIQTTAYSNNSAGGYYANGAGGYAQSYSNGQVS